jgi:hypothetical protein
MSPRVTTPSGRSAAQPASRDPATGAPTLEQIRQRAYEIYRARGGAPGDPEWDWRQAELELRARITLLGQP